MREVTIEELGWLHDARLVAMTLDPAHATGRSLQLTIECSDVMGYPLWDGRTLTLLATDVRAVRFRMYGVAGREIIDRVYPAISDEMEKELEKGRKLGARYGTRQMFMLFHTGSALEISCGALEIDV
jgi:hypothetical protein